ncbi:MAG: response regulator [Candidatus Nitrohelix vancouverensis]|uniref:histidine kinase n=1 Tax=Candidatus Nitrohelix vancouverensis TaxID=2705534 RepID=A0A7T0C1T5_9BACT|nr:MAG: response regulator [Candidatus Nitrohelix vancouverensis]
MFLNSISKRIGIGYALIMGIILVVVFTSAKELNSIRELSQKNMDIQFPAAMHSSKLQNSIYASLSALRGYLLVGSDQLKEKRQKIWEEDIYSDFSALKMILRNDSDALSDLEKLQLKLQRLEQFQAEIENMASSDDNQPALKILQAEALPKANAIVDQVTGMIDAEQKLKSDKARKDLLMDMANFRGSWAMSLANIRAFLISGQQQFEKQFNANWSTNENAYQSLRKQKELMTSEQLQGFTKIEQLREAFSPLPGKMFNYRKGEDWNISIKLLRQNAVPLANEITALTRNIADFNKIEANKGLSAVMGLVSGMIRLQWTLLAFAILLALIISILVARSIQRAVTNTIDAANAISSGDFDFKFNLKGMKEMELLGDAMSLMQVNLKKLTEGLKEESEKISESNWVKSNLSEVTGKLQGLNSIEAFAGTLIGELTTRIDGQLGLFYQASRNGSDHLSLIGSYAYTRRKNLSDAYQFGEGLVGQCALERKPIQISNVPDDYVQINSGLGECKPRHIIVTPIVFEDEVKGVIEIGTVNDISPKQENLLNEISSTLGVILESIEGRINTENLLKEAQELNQQIQIQSEELRTTNEELEEKAEILKQSEEELKNQSEELQAQNEELEEKTEYLEQKNREVKEKTDAIEKFNQMLEDKAKDLETASKYKSEFLANMSHELRTPLNSLLILSKDLLECDNENLTEEQLESMKVIHQGGRDLLELINDILDLSKIEAGKMKIVLDEENLDALIGEVKRQFAPLAKQKKLDFNIEKRNGHVNYMKTDCQRVKQILKNLLSNAFKFTEQGHVSIRILKPEDVIGELPPHLNDSSCLAISVADSGAGISQESQRNIFEAFRQEDGSTSRRHGGTGLGLTISKQMARLIGGDIIFSSEKGKGSEFTFCFPPVYKGENAEENTPVKGAVVRPVIESEPVEDSLEDSDLDPKTSLATATIAESYVPDDRENLGSGDKTILIIEDEKTFAKILVKISRKRGFKCLTAGTGKDGLTLANKFKPDVILLDLGLPDLDGANVLEQLKYNPTTRHIPIHVISGRDDKVDLMEKGAMGYLMKPVSEEDLKNTLSEIEVLIRTKIKRVLIVEDDEGSQKAIKKLVGSKDVESVSVATGKGALNEINSSKFDCVILDLQLPDLSGFELLKIIKNDESLRCPPIIVYTGKELTQEENNELQKYSQSIVVKGADSPERLLDEVSLFLHSVESKMTDEQKKIRSKNIIKQDPLKERHVLIVDDDMRNTFALSKVLKKQGLTVSMADNGKMALEKLAQDPGIDIVLMDIMMPVMDGYQAMEEIRAQKKFSNLPIIALTAKAMMEDRAKCLEKGANDYIPKPVDIDMLLTLMRVLLMVEK